MSTVAKTEQTLNAKSHENGLKHLNIVNNGAYCALFVVNTPVTDNSGIAHGVEHFVFRRSLNFPQPESLFQITALTDVKMNASTLENVTYFHCQSQCQQTFLMALNYLLNGILHPNFHLDDLQHEIHDGGQCGVIYRELLGIETLQKHSAQQDNKKYKQQQEQSQQASIQYGGNRKLIGQLTPAELRAFHQQFYQANDITLVTANIDFSHVHKLIKALPANNTPPSSLVTKKSVKTIPKTTDSGNDKQAKQQKKYSTEIHHLVEVYQQWLNSQPKQSQSLVKKNKPKHDSKVSEFETTETNNNSTIQAPKKAITKISQNNLIAPLTELSSPLKTHYQPSNTLSSNTPSAQYTLPTLFNDLFQQAQAQIIKNKAIYITDAQNGLFLATIDSLNETEQENNTDRQAQSHIASHIISAYSSFLAPRCQGHCYLIQALVIEQSQYLAIYSAFDVNANNRNKTMQESLLQLSHDQKFINESIILAKIKYCRAHQLELQQVDNITPASTALFIKALSQLN